MIELEAAQMRYDALRERDRMIASMQSKQRMISVFEHLLDDPARELVADRLREALDSLRAEARELGTALARVALVEVAADDIGRMRGNLQRFEAYLDENPSERLDACHDLLVFLKELAEVQGPLRLVPHPLD